MSEISNSDLGYPKLDLEHGRVWATTVPTTQPLYSPPRDEPIELMLKTRIKETELIQGIPGSHINLKMTNEEFLDRDDNLL